LISNFFVGACGFKHAFEIRMAVSLFQVIIGEQQKVELVSEVQKIRRRSQLTVLRPSEARLRISEPTPKRELFTYCLVVIEISEVSEQDSKRIASSNFIEESQFI
jgi:hypothetical protein